MNLPFALNVPKKISISLGWGNSIKVWLFNVIIGPNANIILEIEINIAPILFFKSIFLFIFSYETIAIKSNNMMPAPK